MLLLVDMALLVAFGALYLIRDVKVVKVRVILMNQSAVDDLLLFVVRCFFYSWNSSWKNPQIDGMLLYSSVMFVIIMCFCAYLLSANENRRN